MDAPSALFGFGLLFVALAFLGLLREYLRRARAEREIAPLFDRTPDLLAVCGFDGVFRRVNPAWEQTLGYGLETLTKAPFVELVHPDDRDRTTAEFSRQLAGREAISFENRYRHADGSYRWLQWNAIPDTSRRLIFAIGRDVTAQKRTAEEGERARLAAEAANRELEAFSYSISHDLRAPLRALDGFSQILVEDHADALPAEGRRHLERIRAASQRMAALIDDLLRLARISRAELSRERVDLSAVAHEVVAGLRHAEPDREVTVAIEPGLVAAADGALVRVALTNLFANAWKFTRGRERASVRFGAERDGDVPIFFVADDGVGFDMRYAEKLFSPFQRLHSAREFEGTGVGLAIVARVVARHGGRIRARSAVGEGATFAFTLAPSPGA